jgi:hypothetical protein
MCVACVRRAARTSERCAKRGSDDLRSVDPHQVLHDLHPDERGATGTLKSIDRQS